MMSQYDVTHHFFLFALHHVLFYHVLKDIHITKLMSNMMSQIIWNINFVLLSNVSEEIHLTRLLSYVTSQIIWDVKENNFSFVCPCLMSQTISIS